MVAFQVPIPYPLGGSLSYLLGQCQLLLQGPSTTQWVTPWEVLCLPFSLPPVRYPPLLALIKHQQDLWGPYGIVVGPPSRQESLGGDWDTNSLPGLSVWVSEGCLPLAAIYSLAWVLVGGWTWSFIGSSCHAMATPNRCVVGHHFGSRSEHEDFFGL